MKVIKMMRSEDGFILGLTNEGAVAILYAMEDGSTIWELLVDSTIHPRGTSLKSTNKGRIVDLVKK